MLRSCSAGLEENSATEAAEVEKEVATLGAEVETLQQKVSLRLSAPVNSSTATRCVLLYQNGA